MQVRTSDFRQRKEQKIKQIEEARKLEEVCLQDSRFRGFWGFLGKCNELF